MIRLLLFCLLLTACTKTASLKGVHPASAPVETTVTTINSGTVEAENMGTLGFGISGRVAQVLAKPGDRVKAGQVLAELENADLRTIYREAQKENERAKKLLDEGLVSKVGFQEAIKAYEIAKMNYDRSVIRAPFDGVVTEVNLRVGELSGPQTPGTGKPMRLIDEKPRLVKGDIDEVDLARVKSGQKARIRVPASRTEPFPAKVSRVVPFVDTTKEQDRTSQIELRMDGAEAAIPVGASAEIEIVTDAKEGALAVPARTVLGSGKTRYVYVAKDGKLAKVAVETGIGNYDRVEILKGVTANDVVVFPSEDADLTDGLRVHVELVPWP